MSLRPEHCAILGGGLAGLSLALALRDHGITARITIVEPRHSYDDDRTWCFWDTHPHRFRDLIVQRWPRWRAVSAQRSALGESQRHPYCRLPASAVYDRALARIRNDPATDLRLGTTVTGVQGDTVQTDRGAFAADVIYDGRPPPARRPAWPGCLQQFIGRRLRFSEPCFEPGICDVMDFRLPQEWGPAFLYVLPEDRHTALVEATVLSAETMPRARLAALLERTVAARYGAPVQCYGEESGALPMMPDLTAPADGDTIPIGTRAGAPRPSTGYAFIPIQRHSDALARAAARGQPSAVPVRGAFTGWLDRVFLTALAANPLAAPDYFVRLFARVPADRLARFLMERGGPVDHARVMAALPTRPFLAAAGQQLRHRGPAVAPAPDAA